MTVYCPREQIEFLHSSGRHSLCMFTHYMLNSVPSTVLDAEDIIAKINMWNLQSMKLYTDVDYGAPKFFLTPNV